MPCFAAAVQHWKPRPTAAAASTHIILKVHSTDTQLPACRSVSWSSAKYLERSPPSYRCTRFWPRPARLAGCAGGTAARLVASLVAAAREQLVAAARRYWLERCREQDAPSFPSKPCRGHPQTNQHHTAAPTQRTSHVRQACARLLTTKGTPDCPPCRVHHGKHNRLLLWPHRLPLLLLPLPLLLPLLACRQTVVGVAAEPGSVGMILIRAMAGRGQWRTGQAARPRQGRNTYTIRR